MRKFTVVNRLGVKVSTVEAKGNLEALCLFVSYDPTQLPDFPMHTYQGVLFAEVNRFIYCVFDSEDKPDLDFLETAQETFLTGSEKTKLLSTVKRLLSLRPSNQLMEVAHVV